MQEKSALFLAQTPDLSFHPPSGPASKLPAEAPPPNLDICSPRLGALPSLLGSRDPSGPPNQTRHAAFSSKTAAWSSLQAVPGPRLLRGLQEKTRGQSPPRTGEGLGARVTAPWARAGAAPWVPAALGRAGWGDAGTLPPARWGLGHWEQRCGGAA